MASTHAFWDYLFDRMFQLKKQPLGPEAWAESSGLITGPQSTRSAMYQADS